MSEDTPTYTVSFKSHPGYEASLLVVRGETVDELVANTLAVHENLVGLITETEALFKVAQNVAGVESNVVANPTPAVAAAPAAAPAPAGAGSVIYTCAHGKRDRREGTKNGRKWVGHFCALPKGSAGSCEAIFEDNPK